MCGEEGWTVACEVCVGRRGGGWRVKCGDGVVGYVPAPISLRKQVRR